MIDNYDDLVALKDSPEFRIADMTKGKAKDDGCRGVHLYFQVDNHHYPIEIQYNKIFLKLQLGRMPRFLSLLI